MIVLREIWPFRPTLTAARGSAAGDADEDEDEEGGRE